jgi:CheY-like chemotaxis protein
MSRFQHGIGSVPPGASISPGSSKARTVDRAKARTVFIVDDEVLVANSVAQILERNGFAATAFYAGHDAIEQAQVQCPDVLVSDVVMPEINGVQLAIAVRHRCPVTRIILFSGQAATADLLREAEQDGYFFELLPKPIHPRQLLKALSS